MSLPCWWVGGGQDPRGDTQHSVGAEQALLRQHRAAGAVMRAVGRKRTCCKAESEKYCYNTAWKTSVKIIRLSRYWGSLQQLGFVCKFFRSLSAAAADWWMWDWGVNIFDIPTSFTLLWVQRASEILATDNFCWLFFAAVVFCNVFLLYIYSDISSDLGLSLCLDWSEDRGPKAGEKLMKASKASCWSTDPLHFLGDHVHAVWKADQQQMCKQLALPIHGSVSALYNPGNAAILGFLTWLHKALPPRDLVNNFGKVGWAIVKSSVLAGGPGSVPPNQSPSRSCGLIWNATESPHCSVCVRFKS